MPMNDENKTCCICERTFNEWGNNPAPCASIEDGPCCDACNMNYVIPARMRDLFVDRPALQLEVNNALIQ